MYEFSSTLTLLYMIKWIRIPDGTQTSPFVIEEYGACIECLYNHSSEQMSQQLTLHVFKAQKRWEIRSNLLHRKEWKGSMLDRLGPGEFELNEKYISTGKSYWSLHCPMLMQQFAYKGHIGSYGVFASLEDAQVFGEKEFRHMFSQLPKSGQEPRPVEHLPAESFQQQAALQG